MLIFADYLGQVDAIKRALEAEGHFVLTLTGETKDRKSVMEVAEAYDQCIVIASSRISAGYEFKTCPVVIFASKSTRYRNFEQGIGRVQRSDAIKVNLYINLITKGGMDEACHDTIISGQDFQEKVMSNEEII